MDIAQWPQQAIGVPETVEKKARPHKQEAVNCPRCNSTNTKFCYYNNYSLSQPRYYCKTCRRYWTEGGSLRNVPVGGGSRKNRRPSSSSPPILYSKNNRPMISDNLSPPYFLSSSSPRRNPKLHQGQDLNLAYNPSSSHYCIGLSEFPNPNPENPNFPNHLPVMEFLKTGNNNNINNNIYNSSGFPVLRDLKPGSGFSVDGYGNLQGVEDDIHASKYSSRNFLFPFGHELKQVSGQEFEQGRGQGEANVFWNGMLTGGSSW